MLRFRLAVVSAVIAGLSVSLTGCATGTGTSSRTDTPSAATAPTAAPKAATAASASTPPASPASGATVTLAEWKVAVGGTIKSGKTNLTISDVGVAQHELLIFKSNLDASAYPTDAAGDIIEKGAGVTLVSDGDNIDPSGSQTRAIDLAPGKYLFVCNIPGHFKQGMFTVVTVTP